MIFCVHIKGLTMTVSKELQNTLEKEQQNFANSEGFQELQEFYADMQTKGLIRKQKYSLPLVDTIGWSIQRKNQKIKNTTKINH